MSDPKDKMILDYGHSRYSAWPIVSRGFEILVVVGIWAFLVALLLPALPNHHGPHVSSRVVRCLANLRQIGQALGRYSAAHGGRYPDNFAEPAISQGLDPRGFVCTLTNDRPTTASTTPAAVADLSSGSHCSYVYVGKGLTMTAPPTTIVAYEPLGHHAGGTCFLFADGSARYVPLARAKKIIAELNSGHNPPRPEAMK